MAAVAVNNKTKTTKLNHLVAFKKFCAGLSMMAFMVIVANGLRAEVSLTTIAYRATGVMFVIYLLSRIIVRILASYEEMNSGKA